MWFAVRRSGISGWLWLVLAVLCATGVAGAQEEPSRTRRLLVGTKEAPPFAMKRPDGSWSGVSIELWRRIALDLGVDYEFREYDLPGLLRAVQAGEVDLAVAALTVTAEREKAMDFTHPFHTTGLSIAVVPKGHGGWIAAVRGFLSWRFLKVVAALAALLFAVGTLVWLLERNRNAAQFDRGWKGIGAGFWWSAVTMTTVGYGDKAPVTLWGRLVAIIWMFAAVILIAGFTGAIASALTVSQLQTPVRGPDDLPHVRVGTLAGSTSQTYLAGRHIGHVAFQNVRDGLRALVGGQIDAFVYDAPLLQYMANTEFKGAVYVLPSTFERQDYAIAMPEGSSLREPINRLLLERIGRPEWRDVLYTYLGTRD